MIWEFEGHVSPLITKELYGHLMVENIYLLYHWITFNQLTLQLLQFGAMFEKRDNAILLLASLPPSYDNLTTI